MSKKTILIVEDNIINSKLARVILTKYGYNVLAAYDSEEAMQIIDKSYPDLILMDLQLPGINGLQLTRILKANPNTKHIIIVALTANAMLGDKEKAESAGCDFYVAKPFDTKKLPETIAHLLNSKS